jgi:DNA-binding XRE family transcriptional regulator
MARIIVISYPIMSPKKTREHIIARAGESKLLTELGLLFRQGRQRARLTQDQVASRAGLSRPSYRAIETGAAAARASTLVNIARALEMEMMLIPKQLVPAVEAMLHAGDEDQPAFTADPEDDRE